MNDEQLLALPGVMRARWWSVCRGCDRRIEERQIVGLKWLPDRRAWVCRRCFTGQENS